MPLTALHPSAILWLSLSAFGCTCGARATPGGTGPGDADDDGPLDCSDEDGDGRGVGTDCEGPDCDDFNVEVWDEADCLALCDTDPHSTGCPCDHATDPEPELCYSGAPETMGVGPCRSGLRSCESGRWTSCIGERAPEDEICDGIDDDCNGTADDGLPLDACGSCAGDCEEDCLGEGEGCEGFDIDNEGTSTVPCEGLPPEDCITLGGTSTTTHVLWVTSTLEGTISKIDTRERVEVARYVTGPLGAAAALFSGGGDNPSRTSVDGRGDVVVGNRAFSGQGSLTRIAAGDCPDADGDGAVETSSGGSDVLPWGDDECVLWNAPVGDPTNIVRAVAVQDRAGLDGTVDERVWAGLFNTHVYHELDRADGSATGVTADCSPCTPYGAAIDRDGNLWSSCLSLNMCRFDTEDTDDVEVLSPPNNTYGITVDEEGRVWSAAGGSASDALSYYDVDTGDFTQIAGVLGAGIAADGAGYVWVGGCNESIAWGVGATCRVDTDTLDWNQIDAHSRSVAVDFDGNVWGIPLPGYMDFIEPNAPAAEVVTRVFEDCGAGGDAACFDNTYVYSDMTGFQLQNATDPLGRYVHVFEGCVDAPTIWSALTWSGEVPDGSAIVFNVRTAADLDALAAAAWIEVGSAADLPSPIALEDALGVGPHDRILEVEVRLISIDGDAKPRLTGLGAQYRCSGGVG
jgi:hypothetical protein